jgi:hypothetical protein
MKLSSISRALATTATVLAAGASLAGLVVTGLYRDSADWTAQARGTDVATLFAAVPVLSVALWLQRRGSRTASLAVVGGLLYLVYNYAIFAFSVAMNPLAGVYIAILGASVWSLILEAASTHVAEAGSAISPTLERRTSGSLLVAVGGLFALLWIGQIAAFVATGALPVDVQRAALATNPVYALDLAFFLPLCIVAGIGLLRGDRVGALAWSMLIWVPLMGAGVLGGFFFIAAAGEDVPAAVVVLLVSLSLASSGLAAVPLVRQRHGMVGARGLTPTGA